MLLMFKVKNYMSFKDETILDMRATNYVQHPSHKIKLNDNIDLLKTMAIYGANASGKSNLIAAMFFFEQYVFSQFYLPTDNNSDEKDKDGNIKFEPFKLDINNNDVSEFEIVFSYKGNIYNFGFECTDKYIVSEWYYINDKKVYERSKDRGIDYGTKYKKELSQYKKLREDKLYLSALQYFLEESEIKTEIIDNFVSYFLNEYNVLFTISLQSSIKNTVTFCELSTKLIEDESYRERVAKYLRAIDIGIKGLTKEKKDKKSLGQGESQENEEDYELVTIHDVYDDEGHITGQKNFKLKSESAGTLAFLSKIQSIIDIMDNGGVLIIDEISSGLHPLVTKLIIDIFQDKSNTKAQLIFTTHDITLLNTKQFRRDEIMFIDKNEEGKSSLYALSDLKVKEDASFSKDYIKGKYGAIPVIDYDKVFGGEVIG